MQTVQAGAARRSLDWAIRQSWSLATFNEHPQLQDRAKPGCEDAHMHLRVPCNWECRAAEHMWQAPHAAPTCQAAQPPEPQQGASAPRSSFTAEPVNSCMNHPTRQSTCASWLAPSKAHATAAAGVPLSTALVRTAPCPAHHGRTTTCVQC